MNVVKYFKGLIRNVVILLFMKVVDCLLVYSKEKVENYISICFLLIKLLSEEKVGM